MFGRHTPAIVTHNECPAIISRDYDFRTSAMGDGIVDEITEYRFEQRPVTVDNKGRRHCHSNGHIGAQTGIGRYIFNEFAKVDG